MEAVMSMYYGAKAKVKYSNDQFTNFIDLSIEVLQGDTLAPYLFLIVVDYAMRVPLARLEDNNLSWNQATYRIHCEVLYGFRFC